MKKIVLRMVLVSIACTISFLLSSQTTLGPFTYYSTNQGGIMLGQAQINNIPCVAGDLVAAFDSEGECVGAEELVINAGTAYINMVIYGDDGSGHGMTAGEDFILKVYDASADEVLEYNGAISGWQNTNFSPMPGLNNVNVVYNFIGTPPCEDATADAGENDVICEGDVYVMTNATADNYESLLWSSAGDGEFDDTGILNPQYTPGLQDIIDGSVELCLTAFAFDDCQDATNCMTLMIQASPQIEIGVDEVSICEGDSYFFDATTVSFQSQVLWFTNDGSGLFDNENLINPTYFPSPSDWMLGAITIGVYAQAIAPCLVNDEDYMDLSFMKFPEISASEDASIYQNQSYQLIGIADHFDDLLWETSGDGAFSNPTILNPVYTPGTIDISNGTVELCLTGTNQCGNNSDCMNLDIVPVQLALSIPNDLEVCNGMDIIIPIVLNNPDNEEIEAIDMVITYDEQIINVFGATLAGTVIDNQEYILQSNTNTPGEVTLVIYAGGDLFHGEGNICFIMCTGIGGMGECSPLTFDFTEINENTTGTVNGQICICQFFNISGQITYFHDNGPIPNVNLLLDGNNNYNAITDGQGDFIFEDVEVGDYLSTPSKTDDFAGLSGMDASRIARYSADLYPLDCNEQIAAEVSLNGTITGTDASRVARYAAGLITELNDDNTNWVFIPELITDCQDWPLIEYVTTRSYTNLNSDMANENFIGIRLGDVSGNWSPDDNLKYIENSMTGQIAQYKIYDLEKVSVSVNSIAEFEIEGIDLRMLYDQKNCWFKGIDFSNSILNESDYEYQVNATNNKITLTIYGTGEIYEGAGLLVELMFEVKQASNEPNNFYLSRFHVNEQEAFGFLGMIDQSTENELKSQEISVVIENSASSMQIFPNPFGNKTTISYKLIQQEHVDIKIYDLNGNIVKNLMTKEQISGDHKVDWKGVDEFGNILPQGVYLVKMKTNTWSESQRIILVH